MLAYPENAKLELSVYGNHLASQHMRYQWKITGNGSILIQSGGAGSQDLERDLHAEDGIVRRFLREALPFGGVLSNKKGAKPRECCQCYPFGLASSHEFYALSTFRIPGRSGQSARLEGKRDAPERP
ncbi:hypothetical protein HMSSN139_49380 [Paenibacillus sp. HMSSN-139]|nr:hypothetical protein HMSSN139_49380 [Paenibacillus sp. HMSSN-139]